MSAVRAPTRLRALVPSLPACVGGILVIALPLAFGRTWLSMDGDPGRHIRVGETILRSGLFYTDPFSFTKFGARFVPYEWLSEIIFAASVRLAGLAGLVVLTGAVLGLTYTIVAHSLVRRGVSAVVAIITLFLVLALGMVHWQARPHVFTLLGTAVLVLLIDRSDHLQTGDVRRTTWSAVWPAILLFALWANLHGGFLYGLCMLIAVVIGDRLEMLAAGGRGRVEARERWRGALIRHAAMLAAALLAILLTPSGIGLYAHTIGYLGDSYLVNNTQEYMSPDFHILRFAAIAIVLTVGILAILPRRPRYPALALIALSLTFALMAARNLPHFGIVALPLVAVELDYALTVWMPHWKGHWGRLARFGSSRVELAWPLLAAAAMLAVARESSVLPRTFTASVFPVRAVDDARAAGLTGRLFSEFTWGGYVLYAWPEQRVFIDGQTDFYGDSITREFQDIEGLESGWRAKLTAWRIDLALIATDSPLADALAHEPGWHAVHCDSTAVLFQRSPARAAELTPSAAMKKSCASLPPNALAHVTLSPRTP